MGDVLDTCRVASVDAAANDSAVDATGGLGMPAEDLMGTYQKWCEAHGFERHTGVYEPTTSACATLERPEMSAVLGDTCAVVVAGGSGERFGDPRGKQFVPLAGRPLLAWSLMAMDAVPSVGHIVVVCPAAREEEVRDAVMADLALRCEVSLVTGGATRQDSVYAGLLAVPEGRGFDLVAIHDGARPLVDPVDVERCIERLRTHEELDGTILATPATDTCKVVDPDGHITATPDRSRLWYAQTPQIFRLHEVRAAHAASVWDDFDATDDASLVEHRGGVVQVVPTTKANPKVTLPEDLLVAEALLRARG